MKKKIEFAVYISAGYLSFVEIFLSDDNRLAVICMISDNGRGSLVPARRVIQATIDVPSEDVPIDYYILSPLGTPFPQSGTQYQRILFDPLTFNLVTKNELPNNVAETLYLDKDYASQRECGYYAAPKQEIVNRNNPQPTNSTFNTSHLGFFAAGVGLAVGAYCVSEIIGISSRG